MSISGRTRQIYFFCPIRCTRPNVWSSSPRLMIGSTRKTWVASIRFNPFDPYLYGINRHVMFFCGSCNSFKRTRFHLPEMPLSNEWNSAVRTLNSSTIFCKDFPVLTILRLAISLLSNSLFNVFRTSVHCENNKILTFGSIFFSWCTSRTIRSILIDESVNFPAHLSTVKCWALLKML